MHPATSSSSTAALAAVALLLVSMPAPSLQQGSSSAVASASVTAVPSTTLAARTTASAGASATPAAIGSTRWLFTGEKCNLRYSDFSYPVLDSDFTVGELTLFVLTAICKTNAWLGTVEGDVSYVDNFMTWTMQPPAVKPPSGANLTEIFGRQALIKSRRSMMYGTIDARVRAAPGRGVITAVTLINEQTLDELDWEWVGSDNFSAWTNLFFKGRRQVDPATTFEIFATHPSTPSDPTRNFIDYRLEWTPYETTWSINGRVVHVQRKNETWQVAGANTSCSWPEDHYHYPNTPMVLRMGVWNYQRPEWGNGPIDWTTVTSSFTGALASLNISCYNGPYPTRPNAPPSDPLSQDRNGSPPDVSQYEPPTSTSSADGGVTRRPTSSTSTRNTGPGQSTAPISFPASGGVGGWMGWGLAAVVGLAGAVAML
ncbi:hypothetical protein HDU96_005825 [Phlyctochytrium bullatum]|nr:hypothetical protein HDU96_005825 [Phlyctochytrium bullatum]